jgi:hypothetical protein
MSKRRSLTQVNALIAAAILAGAGPALFVLPAAAEDSLATILDGAKLEAKHACEPLSR